jgi:hypothetical protein
MKPQARAVRIRQFIMEYAAALAEEAAGTAKIVYFDESYIVTGRHYRHSSSCLRLCLSSLLFILFIPVSVFAFPHFSTFVLCPRFAGRSA